MTIKQGMKLSAIIDKLDLRIENPKGDPEKVGADLLTQLVRKAYKAEKEICAFIADIKGITVQDAEKIDLMEFIKEVMPSKDELTVFFKSAVS